MAKRPKRRWSCPTGEHAGILAPANLGPLDVRRFCLECSWEKTRGNLVERICVSAETQKKKAKAKAVEKAAKRSAKRKADDATMYVVGGVHLKKELKRLSRMSVWKKPSTTRAPSRHPFIGTRERLDLFVLDSDDSSLRIPSGKSRDQVNVYVGTRTDLAAVQAGLLRWLAESALWRLTGWRADCDAVIALLAKAAKAAYKLDPVPIDAKGDRWTAEKEIARQLRERNA